MSETGLVYRFRRGQPRGALIIMLHGLSGDENVMWIFDHALPREATVIAPRALYASELGGYSWARSVVRDDLDGVDFHEAIDVLRSLVGETRRVYETDPQRAIVMGFSQGAAVSYAFSLEHPEMLRGVIALAGFLPHPATAPFAHTRLPLEASGPLARGSAQDAWPRYLIIHGTHDEAVPIERAREARSVLEGHGASVEYYEHRVGHKVSAQGMQEIKRWINQTLLEP